MEVVRAVREGGGVVLGSWDSAQGDVGETGGGDGVAAWFAKPEIVKNRPIARCRSLLDGG